MRALVKSGRRADSCGAANAGLQSSGSKVNAHNHDRPWQQSPLDLPGARCNHRAAALTLQSDLRASARRFADRVARHPDVAPHIRKRWGELTESQGNIVAREVGLVARAAGYQPATLRRSIYSSFGGDDATRA